MMFVLICSNADLSIKRIVPDMVRIPVFIVVIASFVTVLQMLMQAYVPALYATLGLFIPLIVVNCILLGRAEAFVANSPFASFFDGLGMGLAFTIALTHWAVSVNSSEQASCSILPSCQNNTVCWYSYSLRVLSCIRLFDCYCKPYEESVNSIKTEKIWNIY